jgi:hypothetical protein
VEKYLDGKKGFLICFLTRAAKNILAFRGKASAPGPVSAVGQETDTSSKKSGLP